jgi:16S rRNA (cytidine1402-2'-O)-methyltransferase
MKRPDSQEGQGTLYVVSTPIGNLEDITLRALKVLEKVDLIASEGVQHTRALCRHYGLRNRLTGYNQHNQKQKGASLISELKSGKDIALVTNAGTPAVSDPGGILIAQAIEDGIKVSPVPGPSAVMAGLSVSGLKINEFVFLGFLSNRPGRRRKALEALTAEPRTMVFFEAPHRLREMMDDIRDIMGNRRITLLREMTKLHEEILHGEIDDLLEKTGQREIKGEITLVVEGAAVQKKDRTMDKDLQMELENLIINKGLGVRETARRLSEKSGLPYRRLYKAGLGLKIKRDNNPDSAD